MKWLYFFRYQFFFLRSFRFGFFEAVKYAAWKASDIMRSGKDFSKWLESQQSD